VAIAAREGKGSIDVTPWKTAFRNAGHSHIPGMVVFVLVPSRLLGLLVALFQDLKLWERLEIRADELTLELPE
jgi:hypothetical protein